MPFTLSRKKCMITNNNSSQLAATKENSMVWMEGRKHQDNRRFLGIVSKRTMLLLLMGLVAFGGAPVLVSQVKFVRHTDLFVCSMYVCMYYQDCIGYCIYQVCQWMDYIYYAMVRNRRTGYSGSRAVAKQHQ